MEEFFGGNDAALGGEEEFEDAEFFGSEREGFAGSVGGAFGGVEDEVVVVEDGGDGGLGSAGECGDSGEEYGEGEGFG